jgi:hypothetical protein
VAGVSDREEFSRDELTAWVQSQAWETGDATPFISVTPDPLRAFNRALRLRSAGEKDICIAVIDAWVLGAANAIECNRLRRLVGEREKPLFQTEVLVWRRIPRHAIIARWSWKTIDASLGCIFPPLVDLSSIPPNGNRPLQTLRDSLEACTPKPTMSDLARVLVDDLGLFHENLTTKQIALMMIGWSKGMSTVECFLNLPRELEHSMREELDYRLYARGCRWYASALICFLPETADNRDLQSMKLSLKIARNFNLPTFQGWSRERSEREQMAYEEGCDPASFEGGFLPLLARLDFNVRPMDLLRSWVYVGLADG